MNDNVRAMPLSEFQVQAQLKDDMQRMLALAHDNGFKAGENVGIARAAAVTKKATDAALGVGVLIGTGIGSILTVAIVGWVS